MVNSGAEAVLTSRHVRRVTQTAEQGTLNQTDHQHAKRPGPSSDQAIIRIDDAVADEKRKLFESALEATHNSELRKLRVLVTDGEVTLLGEVSSFYHKQMAQEAIRPLAIGIQIINELIVR
ncbi:BON domain-containing protein [Roseiconus lacunae]|uniref:BON domain-containing protein n=1 Tax=Roseiconus lacunae TaxID=2605694 RepID=UPI0011F3B655|nr:BON domain-containing protein [Roseiconus lacunae]